MEGHPSGRGFALGNDEIIREREVEAQYGPRELEEDLKALKE